MLQSDRESNAVVAKKSSQDLAAVDRTRFNEQSTPKRREWGEECLDGPVAAAMPTSQPSRSDMRKMLVAIATRAVVSGRGRIGQFRLKMLIATISTISMILMMMITWISLVAPMIKKKS